MRNVVEVERRPGPLEVRVAGEGAATLPCDASNLVVRSFAEVWDGPLDGLAFHMRNEVPLESGTGSSSAAIVTGLAASLALQGRPHGSDELIALAAPIEGHPDNVAAAIAGGFTLALDGESPLLRRIEPPRDSRSCSSCPITRSARRSRASRCAPRCRARTPSTACSARRCSCTRSRPATSTRCRARSTTGCTSPTAPG